MGTWIGSYTGSESGIIKIEVKKSGSCDVILRDYNYQTRETFYGAVTDYGAIYSAFSQKTGFKLYGNFVLKKIMPLELG